MLCHQWNIITRMNTDYTSKPSQEHEMTDTTTQPSGNMALIAILRQRIREDGAITFAEFMDTALYHETHGYYRQPHRKPGRGGDFITSPELHRMVHTLADALDAGTARS